MIKKYQLYFQGVEAYLKNETKDLNHLLQSNDLSLEEKKLLTVRKYFSAKKYPQALKLLSNQSRFSDSFLEAENNYLLGNCRSYFSDWELAVISTLKAYQIYRDINHQRGIFLSGYNLSAFFNRLGLQHLSFHYLQEIDQACIESAQKGLIMRAFACYYLSQNNLEKARQSIASTFQYLSSMSALDQVATLSVSLDVYFRLEEYDEVKRILQTINKSKIIKENVKFEFERLCYQELIGDKNISSQELSQSLQNSQEYSLKFIILKNLKNGEILTATNHWNKLCLLLPNRYVQGFECVQDSDRKSIFMFLIQKLLSVSAPTSGLDKFDKLEGKLKKLYDCLNEPGAFKRKENLIESIWNVSYDPSFDSRFYKLVERLKRETGIQLVVKNRCYSFPSAS